MTLSVRACARAASVVVAAGLAACLVGLLRLPWIHQRALNGPDRWTSVGLHPVSNLFVDNGFARAFATWTWLVSFVVVATLMVACGAVEQRWRRRVAVVAAVATGAAAIVTWLGARAMQAQETETGPFSPGPFHGLYGSGVYVTITGYLLCACAAVALAALPVRASTRSVDARANALPALTQRKRAAAAALVLVAATLFAFTFYGVTWYDTSGRDVADHFDFGALTRYVAVPGAPTSFDTLYFQGLWWVLGVAALLVPVAQFTRLRLPGTATRATALTLGVLGPTFALIAITVAFSSDASRFNPAAGGHSPFARMTSGFWLLCLAYVVCTAAALLAAPPRRAHPSTRTRSAPAAA